jgi:hypothetical protein
MMQKAEWSSEAMRALARGRSAFGPLASVEDITAGADLYEYRHGDSRAFVAVRPVYLSKGLRLDIVGLASVGQRLAAHEFHAAVDGLARDYRADLLACCTTVAHVAKSCKNNGYTLTGAVLTKTGF